MKYWKFRTLGKGYANELNIPFAERDAVLFRDLPSFKYRYSFYDSDIILEDVTLEKGSTDVSFIFGEFEYGGLGSFMSKEAVLVFKEFNLPANELLDVNVKFEGNIPLSDNYKWVHFIFEDISKLINFDKSVILTEEGRLIKTLEEFTDFEFSVSCDNKFNKIAFTCNFQDYKGGDFLSIPGLGGYWVSDCLKNSIEKANLSGYIPFNDSDVIEVLFNNEKIGCL